MHSVFRAYCQVFTLAGIIKGSDENACIKKMISVQRMGLAWNIGYCKMFSKYKFSWDIDYCKNFSSQNTFLLIEDLCSWE